MKMITNVLKFTFVGCREISINERVNFFVVLFVFLLTGG
jgi:hypothetical protein